MKRIGACFVAILLGVMVYPTTGFTQACVTQMLKNKVQMRQLAEQCRVRADLLNSIENGARVPPRFGCDRPISVKTQLESFEECARVYVCALATYTCAVQRARQGMDCTDAANRCLQEFPVPR